jgi:GNAT superfamily N-acetyltransferase
LLTITQASLSNPLHQQAILTLVDMYSRDPMGDGKPLATDSRNRLIEGLQKHPTTLIFLAYTGDEPIGIAVCFLGFSTFAAKQLVNIHDLSVVPSFRGKGVSRKLLETVEAKARELNCCKLTLEVLENNHRARSVYASAGFAQATYQPEAGGALFLSKSLQ